MIRILAAILLLSQAPLLTRQSENGVMTGTIRGPNGAVATGVRVAAMAIPDPAAPATGGALVSIAETDRSGHYRLENIPPGRYYLMAGLIDSLNFYPGVSTMSAANDVQITAGALLTDLDFAMTRPPGVRVFGRVPLTATPRPLRVTLSGGVFSSQSVSVSLDGTFEFPRVVPGRYTINVAPTNSVPSLTVDVDDADIVVGLPSGPGFTVRGVVGIGPLSPRLPDQRVVLTGATAWIQVEALIDRQTGEFTMLRVPPGTYTVRTLPGSTASLATVEIRDRDVTGLMVPSLVEVTGRVLRSGGAALPASFRLMIYATRPNGVMLSTAVRQDGSFRFPIAEGEYQIEPGHLPAGMSIDSMTYGSANLLKEPLKLDGNSKIAEIRVILAQ